MRIAFVIDKVEFSIPLGIAYLLGILKKNRQEYDVFEINRYAFKKIKDFKPDTVAYSVISGRQHIYLDFNKRLKKELDFISLFGGPHPTFFPEMISEDTVDIICRGEGELAMEDLIDKPSDKIQNLWIKKNEIVIKNLLRPLVEDLDTLPFPDRKMFYRNFPFIDRQGTKHFLAHRGCPYVCTYCFNKPYNQMYQGNIIFRSRNPYRVCEEINQERGFTQIKMVGFVDDNFTLSRKWIAEFARIYKKEVSLPFRINARFGNFDEKTVALLKEAGCVLITVGVEAGNDYVRNGILKRNMSLKEITEGAGLLHKYKIKFFTENMVGIPGETFSEALETLKVNIRIKPTTSNCSLFTPYPKLELTEYAIKNRYFNGNFSKLKIDYFNTLFDKDYRKINLRCFFSLLTAHPYLLKFFERFVLPLSFIDLFKKIGDCFDGYYLWKCLPYKMDVKEILINILYYFKSYRRQK